MKGGLPTNEGEGNTYRVNFAVHKVPQPTSGSLEGEPQPAGREKPPTEFVGLVTLFLRNFVSL